MTGDRATLELAAGRALFAGLACAQRAKRAAQRHRTRRAVDFIVASILDGPGERTHAEAARITLDFCARVNGMDDVRKIAGDPHPTPGDEP